MKTNGFMLRRGIKLWEGRRDTSLGLFPASLSKFEDEPSTSPATIAQRVVDAEKHIVLLQAAQAEFNLKVRLTHQGQAMSLCAAIKMVGGLGRVEKLWRDAATPKTDRYAYAEDSRDKDKKYKVSTVRPEEAAKHAETIGQDKALLIEAIAVGNGTQIEIETLDAGLFE